MKRFALLTMAMSLPMAGAAPAMAAEASAQGTQEGSTRSLYISLIRQARTDGRPRAAIAYLDDFDRQHPDDREAQLLRVNCLLDLGQVAAARTALSRIPSSDRSGSAQAMRGHVFAAEGNWKQAALQYAAALQVSPTDAFIANALGYAWLRAGQSAQAVETLRGAHDLAPDDAVVRNNLMLALTVTGRLAEADGLLSQVADTREKARLRQQIAGEAARLAVAGSGSLSLGS
ncbi:MULTISPECIES: tetratricopeptide repeat protein [unclassified Novosphingobium]|uniref:tetratricopeptide repeat protein n=1 Tax=unclassified Novosphingobium TaxID=2644732 RepID=UPI00190FB825|nr:MULTISPECIES: tetratricopeptide repeat protein [unclassified Novosphingobium]